MKKIFSKLLVIAMVVVALFSFSACNDAEIVQHNISQASDKFETYRHVSVINLRSDKVLLEIEGYLSIQNTKGNELAVIIKTGTDEYKMHYIYLAPEVVYLVEQVENTHTDPYHWVIRIHAILPEFDIG
jgi:predicted small secreted protein